MKIKENIGIINVLIRITVGLTLVAFGITKLTRMPWKNSYLFLIICGAMKVAEGIARYCPITALLQNENCCFRLKPKQDDDGTSELDYNPT